MIYDRLEKEVNKIEKMIKDSDYDLASEIEYIKSELEGIKETLAVYHRVITRLNEADLIICDSLEIINDKLSEEE